MVWVVVGVALVHAASAALAPRTLADYPIQNPVGIESAGTLGALAEASILVLIIPLMSLSVVSLFVRLRRSSGPERQQLKWFAYAALLAAELLVVKILDGLLVGTIDRETSELISFVAFLAVLSGMPVAMGIAIQKYRLYYIDLLINCTLVYDPLTRRFFASAGITAGMKVLDVGSGAGDVALLLADLVGPRGAVVGVETNATILETARARVRAAGWTNVTFLEGDVQSAGLDEDFDALVGRWILIYLPDPVGVLRRLLRRLPPGGIVAFQENDFTYPPTTFPPAPLHQQVVRWTTPPPDRGSPDQQMGSKLYRTYLDAGFPAPQLRLDAYIGGGED